MILPAFVSLKEYSAASFLNLKEIFVKILKWFPFCVFPEDIFVLETKDPQNPIIYGVFSTSRYSKFKWRSGDQEESWWLLMIQNLQIGIGKKTNGDTFMCKSITHDMPDTPWKTTESWKDVPLFLRKTFSKGHAHSRPKLQRPFGYTGVKVEKAWVVRVL